MNKYDDFLDAAPFVWRSRWEPVPGPTYTEEGAIAFLKSKGRLKEFSSITCVTDDALVHTNDARGYQEHIWNRMTDGLTKFLNKERPFTTQVKQAIPYRAHEYHMRGHFLVPR